MIGETIEWHPVTERMPDDDTTVLIHMPQARDEPVWLGWYDSEQGAWFDVSGAERDEGEVTKWAHMPTGEATA